MCVAPQISAAFKPDHDDVEYSQGKYMLKMLGLQVRARIQGLWEGGEGWDERGARERNIQGLWGGVG